MSRLPISPVVLPKTLSNQPNGTLDVSLLVDIGDRGKLHVDAARAWRALVAEAAKIGLYLTYTYGGTYRSYQDQVTLFKQRYTTSFLEGRPRKWWNNQWWYLRPKMAEAATPGTSNHGIGLAIDAAFDKDPSDGIGPDDAANIFDHPKFEWFRDSVIRFGFSFELQQEPWHIRYVAGDNVPVAVLLWENSVAPAMPPFDPDNGKWSLWPLAKKPAAKEGDRGDHIKYLQGVLKLKAAQDVGSIDGIFGPKLERAVINVQRLFKLGVDGWVGPKTWEAIDMLAAK